MSQFVFVGVMICATQLTRLASLVDRGVRAANCPTLVVATNADDPKAVSVVVKNNGTGTAHIKSVVVSYPTIDEKVRRSGRTKENICKYLLAYPRLQGALCLAAEQTGRFQWVQNGEVQSTDVKTHGWLLPELAYNGRAVQATQCILPSALGPQQQVALLVATSEVNFSLKLSPARLRSALRASLRRSGKV